MSLAKNTSTDPSSEEQGSSSSSAGQVRDYKMFIDGRWMDAESGKRFESINPFTGQVWATAPVAEQRDVRSAVAAARRAFDEGPWPRLTGVERARLMRRLADLLAERAEQIAVVETTDNGKLLREMSGQLKALPEWYYYFAGAADKIHGQTIPSDKPNFLIYTCHEPVGVVGAIVPWNSPLLLLTWKLAPALAAGCTFVAKPAEQTPASTLEFAAILDEAGFPAGVFNVVTGGPQPGQALVTDSDLDKVAFTGSTNTGIEIVRTSADHLPRVTLELGGKSPNIVFGDADLDAAVNGVVAGIFAATGQTCIAGSRLLVERSIHDEMVDRLSERASSIRLGDPMDPESEMGPVAFREQLERIKEYIDVSKQEGARLVAGGTEPSNKELETGYFISPTIFADVKSSMRIAQEEIFGPVLSIMPFDTEAEAIGHANNTRYGLAAGIWTKDIQRAHRMAAAIRAGTIWVNSYRAVSHSAPFGGYGMSGYGRENGIEALREYTQVKSVWIELSGATRDPFKLG